MPQSYDPQSSVLGIIGSAPSAPRGVIRAGNFRQFQSLAGRLDMTGPGRYFAGNAACHAFMNGIHRVQFASVPTTPSTEELLGALEMLLGGEPVHAVVIPGLVEPEQAEAVATSFARHIETRGVQWAESPLSLWLDVPDRLSLEAALALSKRYPQDKVGLIRPWVSTITPGRTREERLPGSCLVAPLALGCVSELTGVHEVENYTEADKESLREACIAFFGLRGRRRLLHLDGVMPWQPSQGPGAPPSVESMIQEALDRACEPLLDGSLPAGETLWRQLRWRAEDVLKDFKRRRIIDAFRVKCDAEINEGYRQGAVMAVWITIPQRVNEVQISVLPARLSPNR